MTNFILLLHFQDTKQLAFLIKGHITLQILQIYNILIIVNTLIVL